MGQKKAVTRIHEIDSRILLIRGKKVMLDRDLAQLYGATTKRLNEQVKRNRERFPTDFMFQLTQVEKDEVVANCDHLVSLKYAPSLPYAFTEHGAVMLASVLNSSTAVEVSVLVVRAFVRMRRLFVQHEELARKLRMLEDRVSDHDEAIRSLVLAIRSLIEDPPPKGTARIGFLPGREAG